MNSKTPCNICGDNDFWISYSDSPEKKRMDRDGLCFTCAFWEIRAELGCSLVIDNYVYNLGSRTQPTPHNGMAGRWFDIEYFDGRCVRTCDLWAGGEVPERWRDRIPNTARFAGGAERVKVGEQVCWNASRAGEGV